MDIHDRLLEFETLTALTTTRILTDWIDLQASGLSQGRVISAPNRQLWMILAIGTTFTAAGAATLTLTVETDDATSFASSPVVLATSSAIPVASMTAGRDHIVLAIPNNVACKKYLGVRATVATGPFTAGVIGKCWLGLEPTYAKFYNDFVIPYGQTS